MKLAATLAAAASASALLALAPLTVSLDAAPADSARPAALPPMPPATPALKAPPAATSVPAAPAKPLIAQAPATTVRPAPTAAPATPATPAPTTGAVAQPAPRQDSVVARQYKVGKRPFSEKEARQFLSVLNFKVKGKPESTAVNRIYRDERGATLSFEPAMSEWAYAYDTVAFMDAKEYLPDSLIRTVTDGRLKEFLRGRSGDYAFVNYEKTMVQPRSPDGKETGKEVPAYYIGRYLRKLGGRYVLGENFQARIGVGRAYAVSFISYRDPVLTDSSLKVTVPSKELVEEYLAKWSRDRSRLGRQTYPYHPDNLRIRALKPVKVFESYVLVKEKFRDDPSKDGTYLAPRVTVLAEAALAPSQKRLKVPPPPSPVLLHFHFPCTPQAGLCWPDGKQGMQEGPRPDIGPRPAQSPAGSVPPSPKSDAGPAKTAPAAPPAPAAPQAPAVPAAPVPAPAPNPSR